MPKKPKNPKKNQKNPKKTKNQFPISNVGQSLSQKKPKKPKKNQKKPKKTSFQFQILVKTNAKKNQKKPMPIWKFQKTKRNQKKPKKNQCQFANFGVATGFFWFFLGEHPPNWETQHLFPKSKLSGHNSLSNTYLSQDIELKREISIHLSSSILHPDRKCSVTKLITPLVTDEVSF